MAKSEEKLIGLQSNKTGNIIQLSEKEADQHMKLHGRRFRNLGAVEEFTPEEVTEAEGHKSVKGSRKAVQIAAADAPDENVPTV